GNVYVTDAGNRRVQKFSPDGSFLGKWGTSGAGDGQFELLRDVAVDQSGYVYVLDDTRVQKFTSDGVFVLKWGSSYAGPACPTGAFNSPEAITISPLNEVFVSDNAAV